jgi:Trk K+ transport system NAD-binding subunit
LVDEAVEVGAIIELMTLAQGKMRLIEVTLDANSPAVVQSLTLDELRLPDALRVVAVVRNEQPLVPSGSMRFFEGDHVVLMARTDTTQDCTAAFIA